MPGSFEFENHIQKMLVLFEPLLGSHLQSGLNEGHIETVFASCAPSWTCIRRTPVRAIDLR